MVHVPSVRAGRQQRRDVFTAVRARPVRSAASPAIRIAPAFTVAADNRQTTMIAHMRVGRRGVNHCPNCVASNAGRRRLARQPAFQPQRVIMRYAGDVTRCRSAGHGFRAIKRDRMRGAYHRAGVAPVCAPASLTGYRRRQPAQDGRSPVQSDRLPGRAAHGLICRCQTLASIIRSVASGR